MALTQEQINLAEREILAPGSGFKNNSLGRNIKTYERLQAILAPQQVTLEQVSNAVDKAIPGYEVSDLGRERLTLFLNDNLSALSQPSAEPTERLESATMVPPIQSGYQQPPEPVVCNGIYAERLGGQCSHGNLWVSCKQCADPGGANPAQQLAQGGDEALVENVAIALYDHSLPPLHWSVVGDSEKARWRKYAHAALGVARAHFAQKLREALEYRDEDLQIYKSAYQDSLTHIGGQETGIRAVLAAHLTKSLPAEKKTPEERATLHFVGGKYMVKIDGKDRKGFETLEDADIFRLGLISQLAAQGGDHADTK